MTIKQWCKQIHAWAHRKGFYDEACQTFRGLPCEDKSGSIAGSLMLMVTELAEACEADRRGDRDNLKEELADVAIRLFNFCEAQRVDLEAEIAKKMAINEQRGHRHGKRY